MSNAATQSAPVLTPCARTILAILASGDEHFDKLGCRIPVAMLREMSPTLRDLEDAGMIERGGMWNRITPAGRAAL